LGKEIIDPLDVESHRGAIHGLGLLNVSTQFHTDKVTAQVEARHIETGLAVRGYEIHHGITQRLGEARPVFAIMQRSGRPADAADGASAGDGQVWGTNLHGLFDNGPFRKDFLSRVRRRKGLALMEDHPEAFDQDREYDKLAEWVRNNIDMEAVYRVLRKEV